MKSANPRLVDACSSEPESVSLDAWTKASDFRRRNKHLFRTDSALYYFLEKHYSDLEQIRALGRLGTGSRAPYLLNEKKVLAYFLSCANK